MTCVINWLIFSDMTSLLNNRAIIKLTLKTICKLESFLSCWTSLKTMPLCYKMLPRDSTGITHRPQSIHSCVIIGVMTHWNTSAMSSSPTAWSTTPFLCISSNGILSGFSKIVSTLLHRRWSTSRMEQRRSTRTGRTSAISAITWKILRYVYFHLELQYYCQTKYYRKKFIIYFQSEYQVFSLNVLRCVCVCVCVCVCMHVYIYLYTIIIYIIIIYVVCVHLTWIYVSFICLFRYKLSGTSPLHHMERVPAMELVGRWNALLQERAFSGHMTIR